MGRNVVWRRLNMSPKHRWSMLRNMAASLFLHERIITTETKAKCLAILVNRIYIFALRNPRRAYSRVQGMLRAKAATIKLYHNLLNRFRSNLGSITRVIPQEKRRLNDGSKMAIIELVRKYLYFIKNIVKRDTKRKRNTNTLMKTQTSVLAFGNYS
jgi:large subunit ribosomal protein L17